MMSITILKLVHVGCVFISYMLFVVRGVWSLNASANLQRRWVKVLPHTVDTLLLGSAVTLAWMLGISPFAAPWLAAKIIALLLYIVLGTIAIKRGKTREVRLLAWILAQLLFAYIVLTAVTHDPVPWHILSR
ncbi:MAG: SirB2 family protein [Gallionella sp.]